MIPMTEFFTHAPNYETSTGTPNSEEFFVLFCFGALLE
jgi:hypothetical protein